MARSDKEMSFQERYIKNMGLLKEAYKIRTEFASKFKLKPEKTKGYMIVGDPAAEAKPNADGSTAPTGGGVAVGGLLTIDSYKGPDNSATQKRGGGGSYRRGLKGNLAGTDKWNQKISEWAGKYNINPWFIKITMALESGGNEKLTESSHNTKYEPGRGLFQITIGAVDIPVDRGRLFDPDYNMECFAKVTEGKIKDAERKGSPLTVYEIAWRYNGKISNNPYPDTFEEIMAGYGQSSKQSIRPSSGGNAVAQANPDSGTENLGGGPPKKASVSSFRVMATPAERREATSFAMAIQSQQTRAYTPYVVPKAKIDGYRIRIPNQNRHGYVKDRSNEEVFWNKTGWRKLDNRFIHLGQPYENFYSPEAAIAFEILLMKLQWDRLEVIKGFDPKANTYNTHSIGIAMDIRVQNMYEAIYLADTAWTCGFRAIAIGGNGLSATSEGFVHIDCGPKAFWSLNHHDVYKGPGTFETDW